MTNEEKILEILAAMQAKQEETDRKLDAMQAETDRKLSAMQDETNRKLDAMQSEIKEIHQKLDDLAEAHEETREAVNGLLEWAEKAASIQSLNLPKI